MSTPTLLSILLLIAPKPTNLPHNLDLSPSIPLFFSSPYNNLYNLFPLCTHTSHPSVGITGQPQWIRLPAMDLDNTLVSCTWLSAIQCHQKLVTVVTTLQSVRKATQKMTMFRNLAWAPLQTILTSTRVSCCTHQWWSRANVVANSYSPSVRV